MAATEEGQDTDRISLKGQSIQKPPSLAQYAHLHRLDLSKTTGLRDLRFTAPVCSTLTWLSLQGSDIRSLDGIEKLTGLLVLNISETNCGVSLPKSIKKLASLQTLIAKQAGLTDLAHINKLRSLTTLVVSDNQLGALPAALSSLVNLTKLSAARCGLTADGLPDLSALAQLTELRLSHNALGSLPAHMASWGDLQTVALGSCGLTSYKDLEPLRKHARLTNLDVHDNAFAVASNGDGFDKYKSKMIKLLPALRILDGHRFDQAFLERKAKKAAHVAELGEETSKKRKSQDEPAMKKRRREEEEEPTSLLGDGSLLTVPIEEAIEEAIEEPPVPPVVDSNAPQRTSVVSVIEVKQPKRSKKAAAADQAQLNALLGVKQASAEDDNGLGLPGW